MKVMSTARQQGKTTWLLAKLRADHQSVLVTHSRLAAEDLKRQHPDLRSRIVDHDTYLRIAGGALPPHTPLLIDNADLIFKTLFGNVVAVTLTDEEAARPVASPTHLERARTALDRNLEKIVGIHRSGDDVPPLHRAVYEILCHLEDQQERPKGDY